MIMHNQIDILFLAPETITSSFKSLVSNPRFPKVSFVCVDEVHCLSEWSHNFRSSYISMQATLNEIFTPECYLGMTGTASESTIQSTANALQVDVDGRFVHGFLRSNLLTTVSWVATNDEKLLQLT